MLNVRSRRPCCAAVNFFFFTCYVIKENDVIKLSVVTLLSFITPDYPERIINLKMTCFWFGVTYILQIRYSDFLNIICVLTLQKTLGITAVYGTLILHRNIQGVALCCVQLCSYMWKDAHFDSFSCINQQSCYSTDVQICVMLCTVVQLYVEGCPF